MSRFEQFDRDTAYQIYVANSLQNIPQNKWINVPLKDIFYPQSNEVVKDADEIAVDIIQRAGLSFGG